jgi:hypothetical protein
MRHATGDAVKPFVESPPPTPTKRHPPSRHVSHEGSAHRIIVGALDRIVTDTCEHRRGWHESSFELRAGLEVVDADDALATTNP